MKRWLGERLATAMLLGASIVTLVACERDASGLTEWTPKDHDHQVEQPRRRRSATQAAQQTPHAAPSQRNQVIDVTWAKQCATCHGKRGRGDGPTSPMVKARDLTIPEWQATVTDEQLKKVIREGKDKMPAFNLPDSIIEGLVAHVRSLQRKPKGERGGPSEPGDDDETGEAPAAEPAAPNAPASATPPAPAAPPAHGAVPPAQGAVPPAHGAVPPAQGAVPAAGPAHANDTATQAPTAVPPKQP